MSTVKLKKIQKVPAAQHSRTTGPTVRTIVRVTAKKNPQQVLTSAGVLCY